MAMNHLTHHARLRKLPVNMALWAEVTDAVGDEVFYVNLDLVTRIREVADKETRLEFTDGSHVSVKESGYAILGR